MRVPPDAPARLDRLPQHAGGRPRDGDPAATAAAARRCCGAAVADGRARARRRRVTVSAEKGYLKETGNLLFHFALLAVLVGVALGLAGTAGTATGCWSPARTRRSATRLQQYDEYALGARVGAGDLPPFCLQLTTSRPTYLDNGQPVSFAADVSLRRGAARPRGRPGVRGQRPAAAGRAPTSTCSATGTRRCCATPTGTAQPQTTVAPFLPGDGMLTSEGVATFPDANIDPTTGARDADAAGRLRGRLPADGAGRRRRSAGRRSRPSATRR